MLTVCLTGHAIQLEEQADEKEMQGRGMRELAYLILWGVWDQGSRELLQEHIVSSQLRPLQHTDT